MYCPGEKAKWWIPLKIRVIRIVVTRGEEMGKGTQLYSDGRN